MSRVRASRPLRLSIPLVVVIASVGCTSTTERDTVPLEVRSEVLGVEGSAVRMRAADAMTCDRFLERVRRTAEAGLRGPAERLIRRYPDLARESLATPTSPGLNAVVDLIAQVHDTQCGSSTPAASWVALRRDRRSSFERYREWEVARARVLADRLAGRPCVQAAEDLEVPKDSPATLLLDVDAHLVRGDAYWAEDRIDEAAKEWRAARGLAHFALPYDTLRVGLALVALEGRRGAVDEAARIWTETVGSAAELAASRGIRDPGFWERAIDRRPSGAAWPDRIDSWLQAESDHARPGDPEIGVATRLLGWIGRIRLERDEAQLALMALTRACEATESDPYRAQLQILVARAMLAMGEPGQSRLILEQLRGNAAIELRLEARALLAALDLRLGNLERGVDELRAVLAEAPDDWPGRFETEANLGLADLASGREEDGLRRLHAAQNQWQVLRRHDALIQSLANEIRYFEGVGRMDVVRALRSRLAAVGRE